MPSSHHFTAFRKQSRAQGASSAATASFRPPSVGPAPRAVLSFLALVAIGGVACQKDVLDPPNIMIIVVDTLRADRLEGSSAGVPTMPKLAQLAANSYLYTDATAQASWTKPSMVSLFTSLYTETHSIQFGIRDPVAGDGLSEIDCIPEDMETMASYFQKHGYGTRGVQTNPHLHEDYGFAQGFDNYQFVDIADASNVTNAAIAALPNDGPFVLYAHYLDPHGPYAPPSGYADLFGPEETLTESDAAALANWETFYADLITHKLKPSGTNEPPLLSEAARREIRRRYDGEVRYIDDEVTRLVEAVLARNPRTIIVLTSDHGEEFWEHGALGHGRTLYQELVHVPLFIKLPDSGAARIETPVELVDVLPSLAGALGLPPRTHWQGRDIIANSDEKPAVFSSTGGSLREFDLKLSAIRSGQMKLVLNGIDETSMLFDLQRDPGELQNLATEEAPIVQRLLNSRHLHLRTCEGNPLHALPKCSVPLDSQRRDEFNAIGYVN